MFPQIITLGEVPFGQPNQCALHSGTQFIRLTDRGTNSNLTQQHLIGIGMVSYSRPPRFSAAISFILADPAGVVESAGAYPHFAKDQLVEDA